MYQYKATIFAIIKGFFLSTKILIINIEQLNLFPNETMDNFFFNYINFKVLTHKK